MPFSKLLNDYQVSPHVWDEMHDVSTIRNHYEVFLQTLRNDSVLDLAKKNELAKKLFMSQGITFTVYNDGEGIEKIFPFDILPRIITATEWAIIERGIKQRVKALNIFLADALILSCPNFMKEMVGVDVSHGIYTHISGIDPMGDSDGNFYVLEDNLRTPLVFRT